MSHLAAPRHFIMIHGQLTSLTWDAMPLSVSWRGVRT
jgi:hypothetical protein